MVWVSIASCCLVDEAARGVSAVLSCVQCYGEIVDIDDRSHECELRIDLCHAVYLIEINLRRAFS